MAGAASRLLAKRELAKRGLREPTWVRRTLIGVAIGFMSLFLFLPLAVVFGEAFSKGVEVYFASLSSETARSAIALTLLVAGVAVPLNTLFGVVAAWVITKHDFRGKQLLITLIDLPFSVSPVISGLVFVLLFGRTGLFGPLMESLGIQVIFAVPGIVLATTFITLPFVARELIPLMEAQGREAEQAAAVLGASTLQTFWRVTLPNIKWGLVYGVILCNARAMGEFGAVSVVSGHIRGETNTIPLHVEVQYNEYDFAGAFAAASVLALLALATLAIKTWVEWRAKRQLARGMEA